MGYNCLVTEGPGGRKSLNRRLSVKSGMGVVCAYSTVWRGRAAFEAGAKFPLTRASPRLPFEQHMLSVLIASSLRVALKWGVGSC